MKTKNDLTSRQWKLYNFMKANPQGFDTQEELLFNYETELLWESEPNTDLVYGYYDDLRDEKDWNNMSSARAMRKDIKALRDSDIIQKVIVGTKLAETTDEAKEHLERKLSNILRQFKTYHKEKKKLEKHLQTRFVFNQEKEIINAINNE